VTIGRGLMILGLCSLVLSSIGMARAGPHASVNSADPNGAGQHIARHLLIASPLYGEHWFVAEIARLSLANLPRMAYQMGNIGIQLHPQSLLIMMSLSYVAVQAGRCHWALHHLRRVAETTMHKTQRILANKSINHCLGGWRNQAMVIARRVRAQSPSLNPSSGSLKVAAGSHLASICQIFAFMCDKSHFDRSNDQAASQTDLVLAAIATSHRKSLEGGAYLTTQLVRRIPLRSTLTGDIVGIGFGRYWQDHANKITGLHIIAADYNLQSGASKASLSSRKIDLVATHHFKPGPKRNRFATIDKSEPWWWQVGSTWNVTHSMMMEQGKSRTISMAEYKVMMPLMADYRLELGKGFGRIIPAAKAHKALASSINSSHFMLHAPKDWPLEIVAGVKYTTTQYHSTLTYLARPHRDKRHEWTIAMSYDLGLKKQLQVGVLGKFNKISSENSLIRKSQQSITIYFNYEINKNMNIR